MSIPGEDGFETPDEPSTTPARDYMYEEGCHNEVVDLALGLLVARGMTQEEAEAALEKACSEWLAADTEQWWEL